MRVLLESVDVTEAFRRALRHHYGRPGLATRKEIRSWADSLIEASAEDLVGDLYHAQKRERLQKEEEADEADDKAPGE